MDETAKLLNMPLGTVKTHSQRGLKKLRDVLSAWQSPSRMKDSK
jgi:DNA-directed RNA polymerase specialized sigma24 family protein